MKRSSVDQIHACLWRDDGENQTSETESAEHVTLQERRVRWKGAKGKASGWKNAGENRPKTRFEK